MATILVVDDRPSGREALRELLGDFGHRVLVASGGIEALAIAREEGPDLVLVEAHRPGVGMDGRELVRQIRAEPTTSGTAVGFTTGADQEREARAWARECGVADLLTRPAGPGEFARAVAELLGRSRQSRAGPSGPEEEEAGGDPPGGFPDRPAGTAPVRPEVAPGLRTDRARLQTLARLLLRAQEDERRRIARELHDEIGQALTAVRINFQRAMTGRDLAAILPFLRESDATVAQVLQQVRDLSLDLRPAVLDDLGLVAAVRWFLDKTSRRAGLVGHFVAEPPVIYPQAEIAIACFRIVQEALTNVVRHSEAHRVDVALRQSGDHLELVVRDDGTGFAAEPARQRGLRGDSLGLLGMEERVALLGGRIAIASSPGLGTEVRVRLPLALTEAPSPDASAAPRPPPADPGEEDR